MYYSSTKSKRESWSFSSLDFNNFQENPENYNLKYDEAYISTIELYDDVYFIEHNSEFNPDEISELEVLKTLHTTTCIKHS